MTVGDIAVLRIVGRYQEQNVVNTMHYSVTVQATGDEQLWDDLVNGWFTTHSAAWIARFVDTFVWIGLKAFTVKGNTRPPGERSVVIPGTVIETPTPAFICRTITFYTDNANPRRRGRLMLSGTSEEMLADSDGSVVSGEIVELTALGTSLLDTIIENGNEYEPIVYDKVLDIESKLIVAKGRVTPASVTSRRVRNMLIG